MTVYVDQFPGSGWGRWNGGGHMLGTDIDELHAFAAALGLRRSWFQDQSRYPHYDLYASKRAVAVERGAVPIAFGEVPDDVLVYLFDRSGFEKVGERRARARALRAGG